MANEEQIALLKQGVSVWNRWREKKATRDIDLSGADLSGFNLRLANLSFANLSNTKLIKANLFGVNLTDADLRNAQLDKANLRKANLSGANFEGSGLIGANVKQADFIGTNLHEADDLPFNFNESNLSKSNLSGAELSGFQFVGTTLEGVNLEGADLTGANLEDADLENANLKRANLKFANLTGANLENANLTGANLENASLQFAEIHYAILTTANLKNANLARANLHAANLEGANLFGASLKHARLKQTNLINSNLSGVTGLGAKFICVKLTGSCIKDWHINSDTKFEGTQCDYVFRSLRFTPSYYDDPKLHYEFFDRQPCNINQAFKPGEFEQWVNVSETAQKTIDLTFTKGINWQAFFQSLQEIRLQYPNSGVNLQPIKEEGSIVAIKIEVSPNADKDAIQSILNETRMALSKSEGENKVLREISNVFIQLVDKGMNKPTHQTTIHANTIGIQHSGSGDVRNFTQNINSKVDEIAQFIKSLREISYSFPKEQPEIVEQQEIIEGELEDLEHDLKNPENHEPKRLERKIKRLRKAGKAILAIAGATVVGGVTFTDNANKFLENVDKLGQKIGIEVIQDKPKADSN